MLPLHVGSCSKCIAHDHETRTIASKRDNSPRRLARSGNGRSGPYLVEGVHRLDNVSVGIQNLEVLLSRLSYDHFPEGG